MTRHLYCRKCGDESAKRGLHREDKAMGWTVRFHYVSAVTPKGHSMMLITEGEPKRIPLDSIMCDGCGEPIHGRIAVARTMWQPKREPEPRRWENDYGTIIPAEAVKMADLMSSEKGKT